MAARHLEEAEKRAADMMMPTHRRSGLDGRPEGPGVPTMAYGAP